MTNKLYQLPAEVVVREDESGGITVMSMTTLAVYRFDGLTAQLFQMISNKESFVNVLDWLIKKATEKQKVVPKTLKKEATEELKRYLQFLEKRALIAEAS